jgi:hypothetical protein
MNAKLRKAYRSLRAAHPTATARTLLTWARSNLKRKPLEWIDDRRGLPRCEWTQDGFKIVANVGLDDHGDLDWLGEFHSHHAQHPKGAIRVPAPREWRRADEHGCIWYVPANSYAEHYKGLRKLNFGRAEADRLARSYVKGDADRLRRYCDGDLSLLRVGVTVYRADVELGSSGIYGIDVDSPADPYLTEVALDIAPEAIAEAKAKLAALCPGKRKAA